MLLLVLGVLHMSQGVDAEYYQWCMQTFGDEAYCCQQAGGEIVGSTVSGAICGNTPEPTPPQILR